MKDDCDSQEALLRVKIIWLLMREDRASKDYFNEATWLARNEEDNAVPWMFMAESAWLRGDFNTFCLACYKSCGVENVNLHSKGYRQRILLGLKKVGMDSIWAKRKVLLLPQPNSVLTMFMRHSSLLSSAPVIGNVIGKKFRDPESMAIRYVTLGISSMPVGLAFDQSLMALLMERRKENLSKSSYSLLKDQARFFYVEKNEFERIALTGTSDEIDCAVLSPEIIRNIVLSANPSQAGMIKSTAWRELWKPELQKSEKKTELNPFNDEFIAPLPLEVMHPSKKENVP
jgi:hypothetical protein